jgi:hypothetical protein
MSTKMHQRVKDRQNAKTSAGRNNLWDSAESHYVNSIFAIDQAQGLVAQVLEDIVSDPEKFKLIKDPVTLNENVILLNKDIQQHADLLANIHQKHDGKTGPAITQDDYMSVLQVNCDYAEALEVFDANIRPTVNHILELIGVSEEIVKVNTPQALAEQELIDPTVVSDISFKEA